MIITADKTVTGRQNLIWGRLSEAISKRTFDAFDVKISYEKNGTTASIPTQLTRKSGGYFALSVASLSGVPDFVGVTGNVKLIAEFSVSGQAPFQIDKTINISDLRPVSSNIVLDGKTFLCRKVPGAPFDFSHTIVPSPVGISGTVISSTDFETRIDNATIAIAGVPDVTTDGSGNFSVPALPVAETISLTISKGPKTKTFSYRPDYSVPINLISTAFAI